MMKMSKEQMYSADKIFTGTAWLYHKVLVVVNNKVVDIVPLANIDNTTALHFPIIAPAFIDIQIYGAYDKLLAVNPEADTLHKLYTYCSKGGASHFQPTVATNSYAVFYKCIDAVSAYWKEGGKGCIGLHLEGPWIHPKKKGAHIESFIHSPTLTQAKQLLEYGKGIISMITLAPEVCSKEVIALIRSYGIIISAGHSNASYEEAIEAFDSGITTATHLYNAMSPLHHRAPGIVGAIFNHHTVMASLVPDGHHVDFSAIQIAKKQLQERLFVITDAVTETNSGGYAHHLVGDKYESNGILSGSALTMEKSLQNLIQKVGIDAAEGLRMVSLYPAQVMQQKNLSGKIEKGGPANLVFLNERFEVLEVCNAD